MKVLLVNGNYDGGGAAKIALELFIGLKANGVDVYYIVGWGKNKHDGIKVICTSIGLKIIHAIRRDIHGGVCYNNLFAKKELNDFIKKNNIDIVHFHNIANNYFGIEDVSELSETCKVVWTLHEMWALTGHCCYPMDCKKWINEECKKCSYTNRPISLTYDCSNHVYKKKREAFTKRGISFVTPSKWLYSECLKSYLQKEDISIIHNGIEMPAYIGNQRSLLRKKMNFTEDDFVMIFVAGNINSQFKGFGYLEEALSLLNDKRLLSLIIVGEGEVSDELSRKVNVVSMGYIADENKKFQLLSAADLFVTTSIAENFPTVVIESLAAGTPILGFNVGGIPEIIGSDCGWIVDAGNVTQIRDVIQMTSKNKFVVNNKREGCRKRAERMFSRDTMTKRYINLYSEILRQ